MYGGPDPKSINKKWPSHSYEYITCLITGESKKSILNKYLKKYGYNRESYLLEFPEAPLISEKSRNNYKKSALTEKGKRTRKNNMKNLNLNDAEFQKKRNQKFKEFLDSPRSEMYRKNASERAKKQHLETDLDEKVSNYFKTRYKNSEDQRNRSERIKGKNNFIYNDSVREKIKNTYIKNSLNGKNNKQTRFKKKKYENTDLIYQSSYEFDFLNLCKEYDILDRVQNCFCLVSDEYPYNYYEPDFLLDKSIVIEIKSSYIERLQENKCPGILNLKKNLVESTGYKFMYIRDKIYTEFFNYIKKI